MFNNHNKYVLSKRRGGYFFARIVHPDSTLIATTLLSLCAMFTLRKLLLPTQKHFCLLIAVTMILCLLLASRSDAVHRAAAAAADLNLAVVVFR